MDKIPTAEEMEQSGEYDDHQSMMIAFAKLHVKAALKSAAEKAQVMMVSNCSDHTPYYGACVSCGRIDNPEIPSESINESSILTAYPPENIK